MSDDNDFSHWFKEDDDWLESLVSIIRNSLWDPVSVTFEQLRRFLDELSAATERTKHKVELRTLESVARSFDLNELPAASLIALAALVEQEAASGEKRQGSGSLGKMPLSQVSSILRPKVGRMRVTDVVAVATLAARQAKNADVFDELDLDTVVDVLSQRGLRSYTLGELRATMEGLITAGVLAKR